MNVILTREAEDDLGRLSRDIAARIVTKLYWFADHFDELTPEPLGAKLRGFYKLRIGD